MQAKAAGINQGNFCLSPGFLETFVTVVWYHLAPLRRSKRAALYMHDLAIEKLSHHS
jgi:hypothetical protein